MAGISILEASLPASGWPYSDGFFLFLLGENYAVSRVLVAFKLIAAWVLEALFSTSLQDCHSTISGDWCLIKEEKLV